MTEKNYNPQQKNMNSMKKQEKASRAKVENKAAEPEAKAKKKQGAKKVQEPVKKEEAIINGKNLSISTKHAVAICKFISGKKIETAIAGLEEVVKKKRAIPMKGEVPHRKGMERGRYPVKAAAVFVQLLKSLNANCSANDVEEPVIMVSKANKAARPYKRFGSRRFKKSHVTLVAREKIKKGQSQGKPKTEKLGDKK